MTTEPAETRHDPARNLSVAEIDLAARLRAHRLNAGFSRQDLADRADLSERSIRDIENGHRARVQDKTVMLLAEALGCAPADLARFPAPRSRRRMRWGVALGGVALVVLALFAWQVTLANATWEIVDGDLIMRDGLLQRVMWRVHENVSVRVAADAPWDDGTMIVGFYNATDDGSQAWRIRRDTGARVATYAVDETPVRQAFGDDILAERHGFGCSRIRFMDFDGVGPRELVLCYTHAQYYPGVVAVYEPGGTTLGQYVNRGHISTLFIGNLDDDDRDELLALGTNNDPAYQGATVIYLEEGAWSGAAVDPPRGPGRGPVGDIADGARYRLVLPAFSQPVMQQIQKVRIRAFSPHSFKQDDGSYRIAISAGHPDSGGVIILCDDRLRPSRALASDVLWGIVSRWPEPFGQPDEFPSAPWLDRWLEQSRWSSLRSDVIARGPVR